MKKKKFYEKFHKDSRSSSKFISENNFTYINILKILDESLENMKKNQQILDIGCGVGTLSLYCASKGLKVTGLDISKTAISKALKTAEKFGLNNLTKFIVKDVESLNFRRNKYDLIICSEIIEHLEEDSKLIKRIFGMLKNNGKIIITVPSINAPLHKIGYTAKFDRKVGHLRRYSESNLGLLVKSSGFKSFKIFKAEGALRNFLFLNDFFGNFIRFIKGPFIKIFTLMDKFLLLIFGESQLILVGTK